MNVPPTDDINRDMKEPFWWKEEVHTYIGGNYDKFHALCEKHFNEKLSEELEEAGVEKKDAESGIE